MSKVNYKAGSPWSTTGQTSWYLGLLNYKGIPQHPTDKPYQVGTRFHERPDLLAHELYGTRDFWWVFKVLNMDLINDPIYDLKAGMWIYVPTRDRVQTLGNLKA